MNVSLACQSCSPFTNNMIIAREDTAFDVVIGPSGNERGYMGITGNKHITDKYNVVSRIMFLFFIPRSCWLGYIILC